jgi:peptide deformylase
MSVLKILEVPNPLLKQRSEPVEEITPEIQKTLDDMLETMYQANGVGLAAPQVGILKRMLVIDTSKSTRYGNQEKTAEPVFVINPKIIKKSEETKDFEEGCLSIPNQRAKVTRPAAVTVEYQDKSGKQIIKDLDGFMAVVFQHEIDHLDGILYVDRLNVVQRKNLSENAVKQR